MLFKNNQGKLPELMKIVNSIDKEHNGYVTQTELDDILKHIFSLPKSMSLTPKEKTPTKSNKSEIDEMTSNLKNYDLKHLYKPFSSSANRVLIDYKKFRDFIKEGLKILKMPD